MKGQFGIRRLRLAANDSARENWEAKRKNQAGEFGKEIRIFPLAPSFSWGAKRGTLSFGALAPKIKLALKLGEIMAGYAKIWIHLIWATKNRQPLIAKAWRKKLYDHIRQNARSKGIYVDRIGGTADHIHLLVALRGDQSAAKVAFLLKGESSRWINAQNPGGPRFEWQEGYLAISVSESVVPTVREYIRNQEEHHRYKTFSEEYEKFLQKLGFGDILKNQPFPKEKGGANSAG